MKLFFRFLNAKKKIIITYIIFAVIFIISFILYRLPAAAVVYPLVLTTLTGTFFIAADFIRFRRKHAALQNISRLSAAMITSLPESTEIYDEDYKTVISALREEVIRSEDSFNDRYRDMTEYYSVWAHQIKTPIASMKLTLQGEDSPASRKLTSELMRIEQYVEMVLAFIRLDSSSTDYVFKEYSVDGIIRQSVRKFAPDFISKKIRLEYDEINENIVTDEKWLSFVIEQVLSNSLKYTKDGSVRIYKTENRQLCIEDTGIGIAPEDLPRIFEKGYTGFNGRADKSASGIGLYLCKRICDNLMLKIKAESEPGEGTKILIDLNQSNIKHE